MMKETKADLKATIVFLENELKETKRKLEFYEQQFKPAAPVTPPPDCHNDKTSVRVSLPNLEELPADDEGSASKTDSTVLITVDHIALTNTEAHGASSNTTPILQPSSSTGTEKARQGRKRKKWETDASALLLAIKKPQHETRYLDTISYHGIIAAIVCGTSCDSQTLSILNPTTDPITAAKRYAKITSASLARADLAARLASFQDLIFHSICAVLEYCSYPTEEIDEVMRIRSSESGSKNLKRLRAGAVWANEVISRSTGGVWNDFSDCIAELYFNCDIKMSVYGSLSDSKSTTTPLFVNSLAQLQFGNVSRTWCIPALVRLGLAATNISLEKICVALQYDPTSAWRIGEIVSQYKDSINGILQQQQVYTLGGLSGGLKGVLQREGLPEPLTVDSSPPGRSRSLSTPQCPSQVEQQSNGRKPSAEQATTSILPVPASSTGNGSADVFDPLTFELSAFAIPPELELSVFASQFDFERSLVAEQQLVHSIPAESLTSQGNNE